jgi:hypothetical protein
MGCDETGQPSLCDEYLAAFSTRLKVSVDKVWTTPSAQ